MAMRDLPFAAAAIRRGRRSAASKTMVAATLPLLALSLATFETAFAFVFGRLLATVGVAP